MKHAPIASAMMLLLAAPAGWMALRAQDAGEVPPPAPGETAPEVFEPPKKYGIERYMAGWERNPFATPTPPSAPAAVESVFKDLAYTSVYGPQDNPTFTVVNTRTHERYKVTLNTPDKKLGLMLKSFQLGSTRKDASLEVALGSETATLKYAADYAKQAAAQPGAARPGAVPGMPAGMQGIPRPGMPTAATNPNAIRPAGMTGTPQTRNIPAPATAAAPTVVGAPAMANTGGTGAPMVVGGGGAAIGTPVTGGTPVVTPNPGGGTVTIGTPVPVNPGVPITPGAPRRRTLISN